MTSSLTANHQPPSQDTSPEDQNNKKQKYRKQMPITTFDGKYLLETVLFQFENKCKYNKL